MNHTVSKGKKGGEYLWQEKNTTNWIDLKTVTFLLWCTKAIIYVNISIKPLSEHLAHWNLKQ